MQVPMMQPDNIKIQHHLDALLNEIARFVPPGNAEQGVILGLIGVLCQVYDTEKVRQIVQAIATDPRFWQQQQASKAGKLIL